MLVMISNGTEQLLQMLGHVRLQTSSLSENFVITMKCVSGSCHYETCRMHGVVIPLRVERHTTFAMTTCLYTCHTRLVIANPQQDFSAKPKCEPATSHTCGVVEAIFLQAALVFGLLRYARNDKSQDGHEAQSLSP
jgi:hypothetical protein